MWPGCSLMTGEKRCTFLGGALARTPGADDFDGFYGMWKLATMMCQCISSDDVQILLLLLTLILIISTHSSTKS